VTAETVSKGCDLVGLTVLRGLAVILLVVHHTLEASHGASVGPRSPDWLTRIGESGVDILFVTYGFLALVTTFGSSKQVARPVEFLSRRVIRIFPFYWLCCVTFLMIWSIGFLKSRTFSLSAILKSLLLIPTPETLIGPSWILSYLVYFAIIYAATLPLRSRNLGVAVSTAIILCLLAAGQLLPVGGLRDFISKPIVLEFCFGLLLARWFLAKSFKIALTWSLLGFALLAVAPTFVPNPDASGPLGLPRILFWGVPAIVLLASFLCYAPPHNAVGRFAVLVGHASYAIYLTHFFVMIFYERMLKAALGEHSQIPIIPIVVVICIVVGVATHIVLERPLVCGIQKLVGLKPRRCRAATDLHA
jgi:exopolysaccharide production protein ExoZ